MRRVASGAVLTAMTVALVVAPPMGSAPGARPASAPVLRAADVPAVPPAASVPAPVPAPLLRRTAAAPRRAARATVRPTCVDRPPAERGAAALASLRPAWRRVGVRISFAGPRAGTLGETIRRTGDITVFVRRCAAEADSLLRHVVAHELGHAWDVTRLTPAQRAAYRRFRGIPASMPWFGCNGCADFATPAGDFAETYGQWLRGARDSRSELAGAATPAELTVLAQRFFVG